MGLADTTKRVIIEVLLDDKASKGINELDGTTQKAGTSMAGQFVKIATKVALVATAVFGVVTAIDKMATRLGSIEKMRVDFEKLTKSIGSDSVTAMEKLQVASRGIVTEFDLLRVANRIMLQGIAKTDEELVNIVMIADRLGNQTLTTTERIDEFAQLLRNQSIWLLDNFGISVGKVRERIQELQEEFPGITRDVAFTTATLEEARKNMDLLGGVTNTTSDDISRLKTAFTDIKDELLIQLAPAFSFLIDVIEFVIAAYKKAYDFLEPIFKPMLKEIATEVDNVKEEFLKLLGLLGMDMDDFIETLRVLAAITVGPVLLGLMTFLAAITLIVKAIRGLIQLLQSAVYWFQALIGKRNALDWKDMGTIGTGNNSGSWGGNQASGGISRGGLSLVGEAGPELVRLPQGSHVYNNSDTKGMMGGGEITINVNAPVTGVDNLKDTIIAAVNEATAQQNRLANYNLL